GACEFTDTVAQPKAIVPYTGVDGTGSGGYFPLVGFSPGGVVLSGGATYHGEPTCVISTAAWLTEISSSYSNAVPPANCQPAGGSFNITLNSMSAHTATYSQSGLLLPDRNKT